MRMAGWTRVSNTTNVWFKNVNKVVSWISHYFFFCHISYEFGMWRWILSTYPNIDCCNLNFRHFFLLYHTSSRVYHMSTIYISRAYNWAHVSTVYTVSDSGCPSSLMKILALSTKRALLHLLVLMAYVILWHRHMYWVHTHTHTHTELLKKPLPQFY